MQIENSFTVGAPPDRVYKFLLDVNQVVGCMPGAELSEVVDPNTFKGKVKIKVGPITVAYNGTATIADRDEAARKATLRGEGRETTGPGSARATAAMAVEEAEGGSLVRISTDFTVAGRVAQFGRGVMEDVSRRLIGQMADCIKAQLEAPAAAAPSAESATDMPQSSDAMSAAPQGAQPAPAVTRAPAEAKPVNALSLFFAVLWDRIRRLFGAKPAT
jgi:carbon monoxide dehydrogenase subunit G